MVRTTTSGSRPSARRFGDDGNSSLMNPLLEEHKYGADYQIDRCVFALLGKRALLLRVLNRDGMFVSSRVVATAYRPPRKGPQAPVEGE